MELDHTTFNKRETYLYAAGLRAYRAMKSWRVRFYVALAGNIIQLLVSWFH